MKKNIVLILLACFIAGAPTAMAERNITAFVSYDAEEGAITVSGYCLGRATVMLVPFGTDIEELTVSNKPIFMKQIVEDGDYSVGILLPNGLKSGKYDVYVTSADGFGKDSFSYINLENAQSALYILKSAQDLTEYIRLAEENANDLGVDTTDEIYARNKDEIYTLLYKFNTDYDDASEFNKNYHKMYAVSEITGGKREDIETILLKYQTQLGISFQDDYSEDLRIGEAEKEILAVLLSETDFYTEFEQRKSTDFKVIFEELKSISALSNALVWQDIKTAVEKDFDNLSNLLDNATYKKIKDKNAVFSEIMKNHMEFKTLAQFENAFEKSAETVYADEKRASAGNFTTSGRTSSGGGAAVTTPSVMEERFPFEYKMNYEDFDENHWSYEAVFYLSQNGVLNGYEDNTFKPDKSVTRAEFIKLLVSSEKEFGITFDSEEDISFSDVGRDMWHYEYVMKASGSGIVNGNDGLFKPDDALTREDAAVIMYRYLKQKYTVSGNKIFADRGDFSDYAKEAIAALATAKIISGMGNNRFEPKQNLTRAQAAQLIFASVEYAEKKGKDL